LRRNADEKSLDSAPRRPAPQEESAPQWEVEEEEAHERIVFGATWKLLNTSPKKRERVRGRLARFADQQGTTWDLRRIEAADTVGILLLWQLWGEQMPPAVELRDDQKRWFEHLAERPVLPSPPAWSVLRLLDQLGARVEDFVRGLGRFFLMIGQLALDLVYCLTHPRMIPWTELSATIYRTGASSLFLLGCVGFFIGIVMTLQLAKTVTQLHANTMIIGLLGLAMLRELGPVITAVIIAGRSGSAITASIGAMHITQEIDALRIFGDSPTRRLILPKTAGMAIALPLVALWTDVMGLWGGMIASETTLGVSHAMFLDRLPQAVPWENFWIGLGKGFLFGLIIATVSGYFGLYCGSSTSSLSRQTTNSVVTSLTLIIVLDAFLGAMLTNVGM
jgi:phospholipid/cholesterol/gamma-HCH transport system permease protein